MMTPSELREHLAKCVDDADDIETVMAHDAATRQQLEEIKVERDRWYMAAQDRIRIMNEMEHYEGQLRTELAAVREERDRWYGAAQERIITMNTQEVTIADLQETHRKLEVLYHGTCHVYQQLVAEAQARITELEASVQP